MPEFRNPGAQESFQEKMAMVAEWRVNVLSDLVWAVVPFLNPEPWEDVAQRAVEHFESSNYSHDPMFEKYSDGFVSVNGILNRATEITNNLAEEGRFLYTQPFSGVRKAHSSAEIEESLERTVNRINGYVRHYNHRAEYANELANTQLGLYHIAQLPAPTGEGDDEEEQGHGAWGW